LFYKIYILFMDVDYIIVGLGLAGLSFAEYLVKNNKSFIVFNDSSQQASVVAGGMYNPVVLKRFTPVWLAKEQLNIALPFYTELEKKFKTKFHFDLPIARVFKSVEEQNNWFANAHNPLLNNYMCTNLEINNNNAIIAPFKLGMLKNTGRIDTKILLQTYKSYLKLNAQIIEETFIYNDLIIDENEIKYVDFKAKKIVFCEGFGMTQNPFFNDLPLQESKGELLIIYAPQLKINFLIKGAVFIMPLGDDLYKIGATFNWKDKTNLPTEEGKRELLDKLKTLINTNFEIVKHLAGVRPTVKDRRPLLGKHKKHKNMAIFNGLGTRGVMIAPYAAPFLYNHLENNQQLPKELSIYRFLKRQNEQRY